MKKIYSDAFNNILTCIVVLIDAPDDIWHLYNIIRPKDIVSSKTSRKVSTTQQCGKVSGQRILTKLVLEVDHTDIDLKNDILRISGRNITKNEYVKIGAFHTLELTINSKIKIQKSAWEKNFLERINFACDSKKQTKLAIILIQHNTAHLCTVTDSLTLFKQTFQTSYTQKTKLSSNLRKTQFYKFYMDIFNALIEKVNMDDINGVVIAGPAFYKSSLLNFIVETATSKKIISITSNSHKFHLLNCPSGHKMAISHLLTDNKLKELLKDTRFSLDTIKIEEFKKNLAMCPDRIVYGLENISAFLSKSIGKLLLINDDIYLSNDVSIRSSSSNLVNLATSRNTPVHILSSMHAPGQHLSLFGGVVLISLYDSPLEYTKLPDTINKDKLETELKDLLKMLKTIRQLKGA